MFTKNNVKISQFERKEANDDIESKVFKNERKGLTSARIRLQFLLRN